MQTNLASFIKDSSEGKEADAILRKCVHCGFCMATCPTYQVIGDELDGPRGRIYLIKQLLEGQPVSHHTQLHLDRCLTCLGCETTCPSGVRYGRLLDIGRGIVESKVKRAPHDRLQRWLIRKILPYPQRFRLLYRLAQAIRPILPDVLKRKIPLPNRRTEPLPAQRHRRKVLMLEGCVQQVVAGNINASAVGVLDRIGISTIFAKQAGCCGAIDYHLACHDDGKAFMRRNIDAWWPYIEDGVEAIVTTASGCGVTIKEYAAVFRDDPHYQSKAIKISGITRDLCEILAKEDITNISGRKRKKVVFQTPCTLQHGQQLGALVDKLLDDLGFDLAEVSDTHLCCGSAGTYSILQPTIARQLLKDKINNLESANPDVILTANIGCLLHLQSATQIPVMHWIEALD